MSQQNTIPSPYHFVPLGEKVFYPEWQLVSSDLPLEDGFSGAIHFKIKNHTPLMIGSSESVETETAKKKLFFTSPDGSPIIPGTSIKGMLRSWLEIATHSKLSQFNDIRHSYRDLQNKAYTSQLTSDSNRQDGKEFTPKSKTGWLIFKENKWTLYPCTHHRIENALIERHILQKSKIHSSKHKNSVKLFEDLGGVKKVNFNSSEKRFHKHSDLNKNNPSQGKKYLYYSKVETVNSGNQEGYLIVTGQVSNAKHMNFIFEKPESQPIAFYDGLVVQNLLEMNQQKRKKLEAEDRGTKNNSLTEFDYLQNQKLEHGIPVFYIEEADKAKYLGTAQMFRFPFKWSVGDLRPDAHKEIDTQKDFVELLFGDIDDNTPAKGRVSFSHCKLVDNEFHYFETKPIILGTPKSSFYPTYLNQKIGNKNSSKYITYDTDKARLAGRKKYLLKERSLNSSEIPKNDNGKPNYNVASILQTLDSGHVFEGKVRFHNLKKEELGALVLAMKIHEQYPNEFFHNIGMAKPLGFGRISFEELSVISDTNQTIENIELQFLNFLENEVGSMPSLKTLRSMQHLRAISSYDTNYPVFSNQRDNNDFGKYLNKREPTYSLIDYSELISNVDHSFDDIEKQAKKLEKANVKDTLLEAATPETVDFVDIQTLLLHAESELTNSLIKNIAKELNSLHSKYTQIGVEITAQQIGVIKEVANKASGHSKPKIDAAIKKIQRDILDV